MITLDSDEYLHVVNGHKFRPIEFNYVLIKTTNTVGIIHFKQMKTRRT